MNPGLLGLPLLAVVAVLAGCARCSTDTAATTEPLVAGPQFSVSKGLYVPEETRRSLDLRIVEIGEGQVTASVSFPLRVYAVAANMIRASGNVTAAEAKRLRVGGMIDASTPDGGRAGGRIVGFSHAVEAVAGVVEVLAELPAGDDARASIGSCLSATVMLEAANVPVAVPRSAVLRATGGDFVYAESGTYLVRTPVRIGRSSDAMVEITEGLYEGDRVVAQPVMSLWLTELAAINGGHSCCVVPPKGQ